MKLWSQNEIKILEDNINLSIDELMNILPNRSYSAIYSKIVAINSSSNKPITAKSFFNKKITSLDDVAEYTKHDLIECLECGKWFPFLPVHINRVHQIDSVDYKIRHDLPAQTPLAGVKYREIHRSKFNKLIDDGIIDHHHLADAVEKSKNCGRGKRASYELKQHGERTKNNKIWEKSSRTKIGHK